MRDATFFVVDFFTGDRASDLGRLLANQVFRHKDRKGFLLKVTLTHSFRLGLSNTLNMMGCSPDEISRYVGWRNGDMVNHYNKMSAVASSSSITKQLRSSAECLFRTPISHPSNLQCIF